MKIIEFKFKNFYTVRKNILQTFPENFIDISRRLLYIQRLRGLKI